MTRKDAPAPPSTERIHLSKADVTETEVRFVLEALESGWIAPLGPQVDRFEEAVARRVGVAGAVALSSGTAALHLALLHCGAAAGRVVLIPSMTFAATANSVRYTGAEPVLIDSRADDGNLDVALLLEAVAQLQREGVDIAAVVAVDLFGRAVDYTRLEAGLAGSGIPLIEDAAEALGASHRGRSAGSFGQSSALSFNGNKILTTSGGGMLLSDDLELLARARHLATQAREPAPWYEHTEVGFNYRMSNLLAGLGLGQLTRLDAMIARRRQIRARYAAAFADLDGVRILGRSDGAAARREAAPGQAPDHVGLDRPGAREAGGDDAGAGSASAGPEVAQPAAAGDAEDNCWLTCVVLDPHRQPATPDAIVAHLDARGIEARHLWKPMHLQPLYRRTRMFDTGVGADLFAHGVALPSGSALTDVQIETVAAAFRAALEACR